MTVIPAHALEGSDLRQLGHDLPAPGWKYPVVARPHTGELKFDNYNGAWGEPARLDRLLQAYAVEKARLEARKAGHSVLEQPLPDGSIRLQVNVEGGAA